MLFRFSLYGFLKNQRYFEPFLWLFFLDRGLSFTLIGTLIAFREICVNIMEVPSGAIADLYGRRRCMMLSFGAYIISFVIFATSATLWSLFAAMLLFAVGEAFRTGTHKAMIFDWLASQDRQNEKTKVYGFTRSWSQIGSAVSVLIAPAIVFASGDYAWVFWLSIIPYVGGLINFAAYPEFLDGRKEARLSMGQVVRHLLDACRQCVGNVSLRRLLGESMTHDGMYTTVKDYLQPLIRNAALALPLLVGLTADRRVAVLVLPVYCILHLLSAAGSRQAHRISSAAGGKRAASRGIWAFEGLLFVSLVPLLIYRVYALAIAAFVLLAICHNIWRPIFLSRVDESSDAALGATILSVDSQAKSFFTMIAAPILGFAVDHLGLWVVGAAGAVAAAAMLLTASRREPRRSDAQAGAASD